MKKRVQVNPAHLDEFYVLRDVEEDQVEAPVEAPKVNKAKKFIRS